MGHPKGACCLPSATSHFSDFRHATKDYSLFGHDQDSKGADAESGEMEERAAFGACVSVVNHWADPVSPVMRKCTNNGHEKCTTFERHSS